jgi:hypothetical protein
MDERDTRRGTPDDVEPHGRRNDLRDERRRFEAQSPEAQADPRAEGRRGRRRGARPQERLAESAGREDRSGFARQVTRPPLPAGEPSGRTLMPFKMEPDDVEAHNKKKLSDERETSEAQSPEARADIERDDDTPDVEAHNKKK